MNIFSNFFENMFHAYIVLSAIPRCKWEEKLVKLFSALIIILLIAFSYLSLREELR